MIFVSKAALQRALDEYLEHCHRERNHQGLENELIAGETSPPVSTAGRVCCRRPLGGLLRFYHRDAV